MQEKWILFGDDFSITTEDGRQRYFVDGRAFCRGNKLSMVNAAREKVAFIAQKLLVRGPTYEIHRAGRLYAVVKKELFTLFRCRFTVDISGPDDYQAEESFLEFLL
jgi:uncharacterized protein YxjI